MLFRFDMFDLWTWQMAWRDSRGSRRQLLLFLAGMVLGVAAVVAIQAFGDNLEAAVDEQAKTLLGADLSLESRRPFTPAAEALIDSLGGEQARRISFASMAYFPRTGETRLATVRAIEGAYPFYGEVVTTPAAAAQTYREGRNALVDGTIMAQFGVEVGDSVRIGRVSYRVAGRLDQMPRENEAISIFSPRIYVPRAHLDTTLLGRGSRAEYEVYLRFEEGRDVEALADEIEPRLEAMDIGHDTVAEARENWSEGLTNLYRFLSLVGFVALLLGGIGVASAVHVYVKQRIETVAVLRCLGAASRRTFGIYLVQALVLGLVGGLAGCLLGVGVQLLIPAVLRDFLPVDVRFFLSWEALLLGLGIGVGVTLLFSLLPLLTVRRVSPLRALRASLEPPQERDLVRWGVYALLAAGITLFALVQAPRWEVGLGYAAAIGVVFGLLALVARLIMAGVRRYFPASWAYPWRQGLANLYRPNNQTGMLIFSLGLGTFLIMTLLLVQRTLLSQIQIAGGEGRPDVVLFDIQSDQLEGVSEIVQEQGLPLLDEVPIVTMRLQSVQGRSVEAMEQDSTVDLSWAHRRTYRSTYRDELTEAETVIEGEFVGSVPEGTRVVPVSVEQEIAADLGVGIGDSLVFDVEGLPVQTVVASIREVDWQRLSTNFFVVFPEGVLEAAPQFHVVLTRAGSDEASARLQQAIVRQYPNVSAIDLSLVLTTFDALFSRIAFVIRFMALFSICTGLIVLVGAVVVSRSQRVEESVLLKTLGASRTQVVRIMLIEYLFLGFFATLTGLLLAVAAGWALAFFVFETTFVPAYLPMLAAVVVVTGVTVLVGMFSSRGVYDRPALEVLRAEA